MFKSELAMEIIVNVSRTSGWTSHIKQYFVVRCFQMKKWSSYAALNFSLHWEWNMFIEQLPEVALTIPINTIKFWMLTSEQQQWNICCGFWTPHGVNSSGLLAPCVTMQVFDVNHSWKHLTWCINRNCALQYMYTTRWVVYRCIFSTVLRFLNVISLCTHSSCDIHYGLDRDITWVWLFCTFVLKCLTILDKPTMRLQAHLD